MVVCSSLHILSNMEYTLLSLNHQNTRLGKSNAGLCKEKGQGIFSLAFSDNDLNKLKETFQIFLNIFLRTLLVISDHSAP